MPRFNYRAYDGEGRLASGAIEAQSAAEAAARIAARGLRAFETHAAAGEERPAWWQLELARGPLSAHDLAETTRELAALAGADLPLDEALGLVVLQLPAGRARSAFEHVRQRVTEGASLSDAMAAEGKAFPAFMIGMLRAGEAAGALAGVLEDLAAHLEGTAELRGRITSALLYPCVLMALAALAVSAILVLLVPALAGVFQDAGAEMPVMLAALLAVRDLLAGHGQAMLAGLLLIVLLALMLSRDDRVRLLLARAALALPVGGAIIGESEAARLARTLSVLLRSGVPLVAALGTATALIRNRHMAGRLAPVADSVKEGAQLARSLAVTGALPPLIIRLATVGEETGRLESMLLHGARVLESRVERRIERLVALLTPALTIAIGLGVGGLVASVMSAMLSVNEAVLR
jgi:general secretion pathway protein F